MSSKLYMTENINLLNNNIESIGRVIQEMLKLKLYVSFSLLILSIIR